MDQQMDCLKCEANTASAGYVYGFCNACAKKILAAEQKKLARPKDTAAKKLQQDIERAEYGIHCCQKVVANPAAFHLRSVGRWQADGDASLIEACQAEITRLQRAIAEPWRLWPIYRRADKGQPYAVKPVEAEPVAVAPEPEAVAA